jgi:hypothetical protein
MKPIVDDRNCAVAELGQVLARDPHFAARRLIDASDQVEQRRLA